VRSAASRRYAPVRSLSPVFDGRRMVRDEAPCVSRHRGTRRVQLEWTSSGAIDSGEWRVRRAHQSQHGPGPRWDALYASRVHEPGCISGSRHARESPSLEALQGRGRAVRRRRCGCEGGRSRAIDPMDRGRAEAGSERAGLYHVHEASRWDLEGSADRELCCGSVRRTSWLVEHAVEQGDEADEARSGTRTNATRCRCVAPRARNRGQRLAAYRQCSADTLEPDASERTHGCTWPLEQARRPVQC
jgi:hypothetical protein